jgi:hypothetical protein
VVPRISQITFNGLCSALRIEMDASQMEARGTVAVDIATRNPVGSLDIADS